MVSSSPVISSLSCRERASGAESGVGRKERREWRRRGRKTRMMVEEKMGYWTLLYGWYLATESSHPD